MSEQKAEYITDAMDMIGAGYHEPAAIIEEPRRRRVMGQLPGFDEQDTAAWVKLSTAFKPHIKALKGAPLAVWLYLSLSINRNGQAFPGIRTMAEELDYSHQGIIDAIKTLEEKGYLTVRRGERRYNLYEPGFAAVGKGKEPVNSVDSSTNESTFLPNESTFLPNESSGLDLNKRNKNQQEYAGVFTFYQNNFELLTGYNSSKIGEMIDDYTAEWVMDAFKLSVDQGKKSLAYAGGILKRWKREGKRDIQPQPQPQPQPEPVFQGTYQEVDESQFVPNPYAGRRP